jgi:C4-dicarboxylate-specific signal transduction histidine kinase
MRALRQRLAYQLEFRIVAADGKQRYLVAQLEPAGDVEFIGVVTDISERHATEAALQSARTELARVSQRTILGELAASIVHEINQPLSSIATNAAASLRLLDREVPDIAEAAAGLKDIASEGARARDIVRALRALAKQTTPNPQRIIVDDVIRQVLTLTAGEIETKQLTLLTNLESGGIAVCADAVQLQQVVLNLIVNAMEAMADVPARERVLSIQSRATDHGSVVVSVSDTGRGIRADAERIFEPFFTTKDSGMGMGLSICRSIMEAHGGSLQLESSNCTGSAFTFELPAMSQPAS